MKVKTLMKKLSSVNPEASILLSSDEELNILYGRFELGEFSKEEYVLFGLSGSEVDV